MTTDTLKAELGLLDPADLASALNCSDKHIEELFRDKKLPGVKLARGWVTTIDAVRTALTDAALLHVSPPPTPENVGQQAGAQLQHFPGRRTR